MTVQLQPEAVLYLCVLAAWFGIRTPYALAARRNRGASRRGGGSDGFLLLAALLSMVLVPLVYLFTPWLAAADYPLPRWCLALGAILFVASLSTLWWAHADLGRNFSVRVEIRESHCLVTHGIYAAVRHPIYTHHLVFSLAQLLVLHNGVVVGFAIASCLLVYFVRIPAEEKALVDEFGERYRTYMRRTGRVLPRPEWFVASRRR